MYYKILKYTGKEFPLAVLYYHHVFESLDNFNDSEIDQHTFENQIKYLNKHYNLLSVSDALEKIKNNTLPEKSLIITFDDGYRDNYQYAVPILEKYKVPATFFIATEGLQSGFLWNNTIELVIKNTQSCIIKDNIIGEEIDITNDRLKLRAIKLLTTSLKRLSSESRQEKIELLIKQLGITTYERMMMSESEIIKLYEKGFEIGAHTHSHTILSTENIEQCKQEVLLSKHTLESIIGEKINYFAFPNGAFGIDFTSTHRNLVEELGFKAAFSTNDGGCFDNSNLFSLPRFMTKQKNLPLFALSIARIAHERSESDGLGSSNL
jgi:peptidoglycan/xylan/chitin deacetylase (PgdA/CDA1 family)